ncbi:phosphatidylinositol-glycan biosynthesis class S protein-domain-containing protein [Powellomyces hirtus]|nr:phosphatidylinositol-glycan biosynthesis class S protein-domain-containing protein [Powellomyces hirtus]
MFAVLRSSEQSRRAKSETVKGFGDKPSCGCAADVSTVASSLPLFLARVILSVVAVFLLAAPVWWVTTEVYRAPLPIADIRAWTKPQTDWDNMRTMKYARKYQLTLSLLVANPSDMIVGWDIKDAIDAYIHPFLDALDDISTFSVHSQVQNYATLPITPEAINKDGSDIHIIQPHVLPQFINSAQWNLASVVTMAPPINFILYIPSQSQKPLHLVKANGDILSTNAFLMPRWGGIVIANPEANSSTYHYDVQELLPFMEIYIYQLRDLLGVKTIRIPNAHLILPGAEITYSQAPMTGITLWEHDRLVRWRTVQNIADAAITLNSLATLIERLESMVVLDIIQTQSSSNHTQSSLHARAAITASESAFFDPTMVAMLYFPDEHKYAVYMPLFVPVSVPVLIAVLREIKRWKQGRKKKEHAKKE